MTASIPCIFFFVLSLCIQPSHTVFLALKQSDGILIGSDGRGANSGTGSALVDVNDARDIYSISSGTFVVCLSGQSDFESILDRGDY